MAEAGRKIESAVLLRDQGVEDIREELDDRRALRVIGRELKTELEDGVRVVPSRESHGVVRQYTSGWYVP